MAFSSLSIGRFAGISIELHWTFILLLLFAYLGGTLFFLVILLLFVCVLIHELAHSVTALRNKIAVKKIVLLPIGGASIIDDIKIDPKVEFKVAIAGPLMSLFLGLGFGALSLFTPSGPITFIVQSLFELNIFMAVFNILPAFPMDGGRVFRSYLERRKNFFDATMLTVKVSKYLMGIITIATLLFFAFATSYSVGYREFLVFWNFIIIIFLYGGATTEEQAAILRKNTQGLKIIEAKVKSYSLVNPNASILSIYSKLRKSKERIFVTKIAKEYFLLDLLANPKGIKGKGAKDIAYTIPSVGPDSNVFDVLSRMQSLEVEAVAIVKNGKLLGIVTASSLQSFISIHIISKETT